MLSNTCKYAIRGVIYIALNAGEEKKVGLREISNELNIPSPFLGKILQNLVKYKLLNSTKGPNGGFSLAKPGSEINLLSIIEIIDGLDFFNDCLIGLRTCSSKEHTDIQCPVHRKYLPISKQLYKLFEEENIDHLAKQIKASEGKIAL